MTTKDDERAVLVASPGHDINAILLAAGRSQRMGKQNKLLISINGTPMLRRVTETILSSDIKSLTVVTGFQEPLISEVLIDLPVNFIHNQNFEHGLSTSLSAGLRALPKVTSAVIVCLADMPMVRTEHIDKLISSFNPTLGREICIPTTKGKWGNPLLIGKRFFNEILTNQGDAGAKDLIKKYSRYVAEVDIKDDGVLFDIDTPSEMNFFLEIQDSASANGC